MSNYPYAESVDTSNISAEFVGAVLVSMLVFSAISYLAVAFLLSRVFRKTGRPWWEAFVPVLNTWRLLELGGQNGYIALLPVLSMIVSPISLIASFALFVVLYVYMVLAMDAIAKRFGKVQWFVLLAIFLPVVWMGWLAFDDSKWQPAKKSTKKAA